MLSMINSERCDEYLHSLQVLHVCYVVKETVNLNQGLVRYFNYLNFLKVDCYHNININSNSLLQ